MRVAVFHGSPKKGNTYHATKTFLDELPKCGEIELIEFFMPKDLSVFCTGCHLCIGGQHEKCPNAQYSVPIINAIIGADALVFATPHYGACSMPASMKTLFDHIDFLVLNGAPRAEMFSKKAFLITTGAGSTAAIKPMKSVFRHCGVNRVNSYSIRMFTNKWDSMTKAKQEKCENRLRAAARKFYKTRKGRPHISALLFFYMSGFILKRYVGPGNYPYDLWKEKGYFDKCPL